MTSILSDEFYKDQIPRMVMDSQVTSEAHLEGILEKSIHEEETHMLLENKEAYVTIDLSSSISYTPPTDPYFPPTPPSPYFVFYKLELRMKFPYQAHHSKTNQVRARCQSFLNDAKLEDIHKEDRYIVLFDTYYWRKPLFEADQYQVDDVKSSALWEAT